MGLLDIKDRGCYEGKTSVYYPTKTTDTLSQHLGVNLRRRAGVSLKWPTGVSFPWPKGINLRGCSKLALETYDSLIIKIISPYGCFQEIRFSPAGVGILKTGAHDGNSNAKTVIFDSIYRIETFTIKNKKDLRKIDKLISSLKKENIKGMRKYDAYRFQVSIDNNNKVDVYGNIIELDKVFKVLIYYMPAPKNDCEFFKLYKN